MALTPAESKMLDRRAQLLRELLALEKQWAAALEHERPAIEKTWRGKNAMVERIARELGASQRVRFCIDGSIVPIETQQPALFSAEQMPVAS